MHTKRLALACSMYCNTLIVLDNSFFHMEFDGICWTAFRQAGEAQIVESLTLRLIFLLS